MPATKSQVSPTRKYISLILLILLAGIASLEIYANRAYTSAVARLESTLGKLNEEEDEKPTQQEIEQLLGKSADSTPENAAVTVSKTYTWKGLFRRYQIIVDYHNQAPFRLFSYSTG